MIITEMTVLWSMHTVKRKVLEGSYKSRSCNSSVVLAMWPHDLFGTRYSAPESPILQRPVRVNYFAHHNIKVNDKTYEHTLMCCSWFQLHPGKDKYGKPLLSGKTVYLKLVFTMYCQYNLFYHGLFP